MVRTIGWILIGAFFVFLLIGRLTEKTYTRMSTICAYAAIGCLIIGICLIFFTVTPCPHIVDEQFAPISYP